MGLPSCMVSDRKPRNSAGRAGLSEIDIVIIKADFLNAGQRRACAQATPWGFVRTPFTIPLEIALVPYARSNV